MIGVRRYGRTQFVILLLLLLAPSLCTGLLAQSEIAMDMGEGLTPFAIEVKIIQGVVVANIPNELIHAATWDTGLVGLVSRDT